MAQIPDQIPLPHSDDPALADAIIAIAAILKDAETKYIYGSTVERHEQFAAVKALGKPERIKLAFWLTAAIHNQRRGGTRDWRIANIYEHLLTTMLRAGLDFPQARLAELITQFCEYADTYGTLLNSWPVSYALKQAETLAKAERPASGFPGPELRAALEGLRGHKQLEDNPNDPGMRKIHERIGALLDGPLAPGAVKPVALDDTDPFGAAANAWVSAQADPAPWHALLAHLGQAKGSAPAAKYLDQAAALVGGVGAAAFQAAAADWLGAVRRAGVRAVSQRYDYGNGSHRDYVTYHFIDDVNQTYARGLLWALGRFHTPELLALVADIAARCFQRVPGVGPVAASLGNAAIGMLGGAGLGGVAHLSRLQLKIAQNNTKALIGKTIAKAADALGMSVGAIEDLAVPAYDLELGRRAEEFGEFRLELEIVSSSEVAQRWSKAGAPLKSVPAAVKSGHAARLKELRQELKEWQKTLSAQKERLDRSYVHDRSWDWDWFEQCYFNHGLMATLVRRLVWLFSEGERSAAACWLDGRWVDAQGAALDWIGPGCAVRLWHPLHGATAEVLAWREFMFAHQI
ncbi:MAG TPA: DUF4132 domain-containing protein, partial [Herpetosiphonaceae bacterium]